jgi:hypothetical protein
MMKCRNVELSKRRMLKYRTVELSNVELSNDECRMMNDEMSIDE